MPPIITSGSAAEVKADEDVDIGANAFSHRADTVAGAGKGSVSDFGTDAGNIVVIPRYCGADIKAGTDPNAVAVVDDIFISGFDFDGMNDDGSINCNDAGLPDPDDGSTFNDADDEYDDVDIAHDTNDDVERVGAIDDAAK